MTDREEVNRWTLLVLLLLVVAGIAAFTWYRSTIADACKTMIVSDGARSWEGLVCR